MRENLVRAPSLRESATPEVAGRRAAAALKQLTRAQKRFVADGYIHGEFRMQTIRELLRKGLFYLVIDSPNGQCGHMELTPLGKNVQALINPGNRKDAPPPKSPQGREGE